MNLYHAGSSKNSWLIGLTFLAALLISPGVEGQQPAPDLPKAKQNNLGLYVTAREVYERWMADPRGVTVLDVRTTEEYLFVGHTPMAWNVPLMPQTYYWDDNKQYFKMWPNPDFIAQVEELTPSSDTVLVMCRSGGRSAMAVNLLAGSGLL